MAILLVVAERGETLLSHVEISNVVSGPGDGPHREHYSCGRFGEPEETAHLAVPLLDGYNMFTTGQSFMITSGYDVKLDSIASLASG